MGETSDWGENVAFTVTDTPDPPVITSPMENSLGEPWLLFSGTGIAGATIQVARSHLGTLLASTTVGADGRWQIRSEGQLPTGPYSISAYQRLNGIASNWGPNIPFHVATWTSEGDRVAKELNVLFASTNTSCLNNRAAFYCSGILMRTAGYSTAYHVWNPSFSAINLGGVSFSYLRAGLGMNHLPGNRVQGLILEPARSFANGSYPLQVLCAYPYDGESVRRASNGCGVGYEFPQDSGPCITQNITTLDAWRAHFQQYPSAPDRYRHQCSFGVDQAGFALSLAAREHPDAEHPDWQHNEVVIKTWPQDTPNLPIKAFFHFGTNEQGVEEAKNMQRDFFNTTGRRVPVVRLTLDGPAGDNFSYIMEDQGVF
ncbi:hypothetical protein FBY06_10549 [Pseudomonas sp. SJZ085]|nr:hypothetical protein FBX99_105264 [Pseudomonas sp. SJZ074]TWC39749.1 hypothetical protein FBY06_10549 [Pseudomonas sp. SJZ085]